MGTLLTTASGHLRPKCFRVGIKRRDALGLWGWQWEEVDQSPCEARTFEGSWKEPPATSAETGRWEVRAVTANISCWCWWELFWLWVVEMRGVVSGNQVAL